MGTSDEQPHDGDAHARRVREALGAGVVLLAIEVHDGLYFLGTAGLAEEYDGVRRLPTVEGFCLYIRDRGGQLIVDDALAQPDIAGHPLIGELGVRAYAGWHVTGTDGRPIGLLCAMEGHARSWTSEDLLTLMEMAQAAGPMARAALAEMPRNPPG